MPALIPRLQLHELNDQPWLPAWWRRYSTDYLETLFTRFGLYLPVVPVLADHLRACGERRIVDLCSGSGGPMLALAEPLAQTLDGELGEVEILVTDKYPNLAAFQRLSSRSGGRIRFRSEPVDVEAVPRCLEGARTLFDAFHHFPPERARAILRDAVRSRRPIAVFEAVSRQPGTLLGAALIPLMVWAMTPLVRPFRWSRLLLTYLLPLLPLSIAWDGLVSHLRAYTPEELEAMTEDLRPVYDWRVGAVPVGPLRITYLLGRPAG